MHDVPPWQVWPAVAQRQASVRALCHNAEWSTVTYRVNPPVVTMFAILAQLPDWLANPPRLVGQIEVYDMPVFRCVCDLLDEERIPTHPRHLCNDAVIPHHASAPVELERHRVNVCASAGLAHAAQVNPELEDVHGNEGLL